jgi:hypothetical protein
LESVEKKLGNAVKRLEEGEGVQTDFLRPNSKSSRRPYRCSWLCFSNLLASELLRQHVVRRQYREYWLRRLAKP